MHDYSAAPHAEVLFRHLLPLPNLKHLGVDPLDEIHIAVLIKSIVTNTYLLTPEAPAESHLLLQLPMTKLSSLRLEGIYTNDNADNTMVVDVQIFQRDAAAGPNLRLRHDRAKAVRWGSGCGTEHQAHARRHGRLNTIDGPEEEL